MRCSSRLVVVLIFSAVAFAGLPPEVVSQETTQAAMEKKPDADHWPVGRTFASHTAYQRRIYAELEKPATHEFNAVSLVEMAKWLEDRIDATVLVDAPALTAEGIDFEKPLFSARFVGRPLRTELAAFVAPRRMQVVVRDEAVWLTSFMASEVAKEVRVYQVHDLVVDDDDPTASHPQLEDLAQLVRSQVEPETLNNGSEVSPFEVPGVFALVINCTGAIHDKVERLLGNLRAARFAELRAAQKPLNDKAAAAKFAQRRERRNALPPPPRLARGKVFFPQTDGERKLRESLQQPTSFDFEDVALGEVVKQLKSKHKIELEFDEEALTADGKGAETIIRFHWKGGSLRCALRGLLDRHGLDYVIHNDAICITTKTAEETVEAAHVYQVHDLLAHDTALIGRGASLEDLQNLIPSAVQPEAWEGSGTVGGINSYEAAGLQVIVVTQSQSVHEDIAAFLNLLRDAFEPRVYEAQRRRPVMMPEPPQHPAVRGMGGGF